MSDPLWMKSLETCHFSLAPNICSSEGTDHPTYCKQAGCTPPGWNRGAVDPTGIYNIPRAKLTLKRGPDARTQSLLLRPINRLVSLTKLCNSRLVPLKSLQAADTDLRSWALLASSRKKRLGMTVSLIDNTCWSVSNLILAPVRDYITHPSIPCCAGYPQNSVTDALCTSFSDKTLFCSV